MMNTQREILSQYIQDHYAASPEFLWRKYPTYAVFRHAHNRKWFAIIMNVSGSLFGVEDNVDVMNVKLPPEWVAQLSGQVGFAPAYHMNKKHWLTVCLDNTLLEMQLIELLSESFLRTE